MTMMKKMMQRLGDEVGVEEALASGLGKKKGGQGNFTSLYFYLE